MARKGAGRNHFRAKWEPTSSAMSISRECVLTESAVGHASFAFSMDFASTASIAERTAVRALSPPAKVTESDPMRG